MVFRAIFMVVALLFLLVAVVCSIASIYAWIWVPGWGFGIKLLLTAIVSGLLCTIVCVNFVEDF